MRVALFAEVAKRKIPKQQIVKRKKSRYIPAVPANFLADQPKDSSQKILAIQ